MKKYTYLVAVAALLAAACADSNESEEPQAETVERPAPMSKEERLAMRREMQEPREIEKLPETSPAETGVTGEVPQDLLDKIYADLEKQSGANRSAFTLLTAESVQWPDGSLGCPEPGMNYTQALVNGYRVVIGIADQEYDYHASEQGYFKLCPGPGLTR